MTGQCRQVGAATERCADVLRQRADVGTCAALDLDDHSRRRPFDDFEPMYRDPARRSVDLDAGTGIFVEWAPLVLERRMHRRDLLDLAAEARQHGVEFAAADGDGLCRHHLTLGIARRRDDTQLHYGTIGLVGVEQVGGELGGFAETERQQAVGKRV
jgi:hypothetical protein